MVGDRGDENDPPLLLCGECCKLVPLLWKSLWKFLKKAKINLPHEQALPLIVKVKSFTTCVKDSAFNSTDIGSDMFTDVLSIYIS